MVEGCLRLRDLCVCEVFFAMATEVPAGFVDTWHSAKLVRPADRQRSCLSIDVGHVAYLAFFHMEARCIVFGSPSF